MGCWNGTCGVTNTPIHEGDEIVLFVLDSFGVLSGGGFCYTTSMYIPVSLPIKGKYDGYGGIIVNENINEDYMLDGLIRVLSLAGRCDDYSDLGELLHEIERGEIQGLGFMLVHKIAYERCIEYVGNQYILLYDDTYKKLCLEGYDAYVEPCPIALKHGINVMVRNRNRHSVFSFSKMTLLLEFFKFDDSYILRETIVDVCMFDYALQQARKFWCIQNGAGSQSSEYDVNNIIGECVVELQEQYMKNSDE